MGFDLNVRSVVIVIGPIKRVFRLGLVRFMDGFAMNENETRAKAWMEENYHDYERGFDLAVDCAYTLDLCEYCEVWGDKTFIPQYLIDMAETFESRM